MLCKDQIHKIQVTKISATHLRTLYMDAYTYTHAHLQIRLHTYNQESIQIGCSYNIESAPSHECITSIYASAHRARGDETHRSYRASPLRVGPHPGQKLGEFSPPNKLPQSRGPQFCSSWFGPYPGDVRPLAPPRAQYSTMFTADIHSSAHNYVTTWVESAWCIYKHLCRLAVNVSGSRWLEHFVDQQEIESPQHDVKHLKQVSERCKRLQQQRTSSGRYHRAPFTIRTCTSVHAIFPNMFYYLIKTKVSFAKEGSNSRALAKEVDNLSIVLNDSSPVAEIALRVFRTFQAWGLRKSIL